MLTSRGTWERFSVKCRKTETKFITLVNYKGNRQSNEPIKTRNIDREKKCERVTTGFDFPIGRESGESFFFKQIVRCNKAKLNYASENRSNRAIGV